MTTSQKITWVFTLVVLLIYPLPQLAIDIYLPSWPSMVQLLHTREASLQNSLTIYILFLGLTQLFYGPLSDKIGRKRTLLIGCGIFLFSSIMALFSSSIVSILLLRALQGIGMGCGFSVASSILSDVFHGKRLAKITTYSAMIYSLSAILAPVAGGFLQNYFGWQANFLAMAIYSLILIILLLLFVFETNSNLDSTALAPSRLYQNYASLFSNRRFLGNVLCLTLVFGITIAFNIIGPFLLQNTLKVSAVMYGKLLLLIGLAYFLGSTINSHLLNFFRVHILIVAGLLIITLASLALLFCGWYGWFNVANVILFTALAIFAGGFVFPNCFANALEIFPGKGVVGAFIGSAGLIGTSGVSIVVTKMHVHDEIHLAYVYLILALLSFGAYFLTKAKKVKLGRYLCKSKLDPLDA